MYASNSPDLTGYQKSGYCDNNNFIEVWNNDTKYILINPRKNYIYAPVNCYRFLFNYTVLTVCNMENFNTHNVTNMYEMFSQCIRLISIVSNTFNVTSLSSLDNIFTGCTSLIGGNGTTYSSEHLTAEYARVDGKGGLPGYFTAPN